MSSMEMGDGRWEMGDGRWKKSKLTLEWWSPTVGCWPEEVERSVRFASEHVVANQFEADRQMSGEWIKTEEETSLRNHRRWAWFKVRGDGSEVPREKEMESDGSFSHQFDSGYN